MSVERVLRVDRRATLGGVLAGAVLGAALQAPGWGLVLAAPWLTYAALGLADELSRGTMTTFTLALIGVLLLEATL